ncbi:hypothetical protein M081_2970, partial [Bacteroides fragilis str. 3998 T(B) 4]
QRKFDKLLFFYLFIWVGNFSILLICQLSEEQRIKDFSKE